jgi:phosphoribosyl-ATP pyrophosphohydrolase
MRMIESQHSIIKWVEETFKDHAVNANRLERFKEEVAELIIACEHRLQHPDSHTNIVMCANEGADVYLTLIALMHSLGLDLHYEVDAKMAYNRRSEWVENSEGRIVRKGKEGRKGPVPTVAVVNMKEDHEANS